MPRRALLLALCLPVWAWGAEIRVQALFENKILLSVDGRPRLLQAGETSPEGITLVRADSVDAELEINGSRQIHHLDEQIRLSPERGPAVLQLVADSHGMFAGQGFINRRNVTFLVDTGATTVAMNLATAQALGLHYDTARPLRVATAGGQVRAYAVTLDSVQVGSLELANVEAVVLEGPSPEIVLLGMSFLSRVQMNNSGTVMELRQE